MKPYLTVVNTTDKNKCNCVLWARERVPKLPYGLFMLWQKKRIINSQNPKAGSVAIINVGLWGHVAVVTKVGKNHITIREANYRSCKITERHDTPKNLKIVGYFNPNK